MRAIMLITLILLASSLGDSQEADHYSVMVVKNALSARSGSPKIVHSWEQKYLARLGDGVSIALLKCLREDDFENGDTVRNFLPIIRDAFAQPEFISVAEDKTPNVTLFLLKALQRTITDPEAQEEIRQTTIFVRTKTQT